jgi:predicted DNA-binding transcriptional regulator AlpA
LPVVVITFVVTLPADYDRTQTLWEDFMVAKKVDPADLVGAHEIAERLGLSFPNVVHTWRRRHHDFPDPVRQLEAGLIWDWNEVRQWLVATGRPCG